MALNYPTNRTVIADRMKTDVQNQLPDSDPFLRASFIWTLIIAYSGILFDLYATLQSLQKQLFPDTAEGNFAERWGNFKGIEPKASVGSIGNINVTGTATTLIPLNTTLQSQDGTQFETQENKTITTHVINVTSLTRSGSTVTATIASDHLYASNLLVTIAGAVETEYNVTDAPIIVTGLDTFTYEITGTPTSPATGTITSTATFADIEIESVEFGASTNVEAGAALTFVTPIGGADQTAYVEYGGLTGGADEESDAAYKERYIDAYQNPIAHFSEKDIEETAKTIPGVTRVFVESATPSAGQVSVYPLRDEDANGPIPSSAEITEIKDLLLTIKPAEMEDADLIVSQATAVQVDFDFASLTPDTTAMRNAINNNLQQFFKEGTEVGAVVSEDSYRSAIQQSIDPETGQTVDTFALTTPTGNIGIASGELATFDPTQTQWP